jgi:hypothetical protein
MENTQFSFFQQFLFVDYKLVVICSSEQEVTSYIVSALDEHRVGGAPRCPRPAEVTLYLQQQFRAPNTKTVTFEDSKIDWIPAAEVESQNRFDSNCFLVD